MGIRARQNDLSGNTHSGATGSYLLKEMFARLDQLFAMVGKIFAMLGEISSIRREIVSKILADVSYSLRQVINDPLHLDFSLSRVITFSAVKG
jgi:hypothetical protein